jgi:hypothetical protein
MGEIVNLRRARKRRVRSESAAAADANRVKFGVGKSDRAAAGAQRDLENARLDGALRDRSSDDEPR